LLELGLGRKLGPIGSIPAERRKGLQGASTPEIADRPAGSLRSAGTEPRVPRPVL
jgi:hypothetical protein